MIDLSIRLCYYSNMSNHSVFKQPEDSRISPRQTPLYEWKEEDDPEIRHEGYITPKKPDVFVPPTAEAINQVPDFPSGDEPERRVSSAWDELGGHAPAEISLESKVALYNAGLGSKQMRAEVERHFAEEERERQHEVNKIGAATVRQANLPDRPLTNEELARQRIAEQRRGERA